VVGLLGANGAGKSTLMQMLATVTKPTAGRIFFNDVDVVAKPDPLRKRLGYLPQDFGVYENLTAYEFLGYFAALKGVRSRTRIQQMLELVNLHHAANRAVGGFSGGMKQRLGIAQALINDPDLVIVDEPTAGLDPEERSRFLDLLNEIGEDVVVVLSTHIVEDVSDVCQGMAILVDGQVRCQGDPRAVLDTLAGTVWRKTVSRAELAAFRRDHVVLGTRWHAGHLVVHVISPDRPEEGFEAVPPDLRDLYFHTLSGHAPTA